MKKCINAVSAFLTAVLIFSFSSCTDKTEKSVTAAAPPSGSAVSKITESAENGHQDYVSVYKEYLADYMKNADDISNNRPCFSLHYLDSDDIPELFVSQGTDRVSRVIIISFDGEKITELGTLGYFGIIGFEEKTGTVVKTSTSKSQIVSTVYKIKNGKLEEYWQGNRILGDSINKSTQEQYSSNGKTVNKAEFDRDFKENMPGVILTNRFNIESRAFPSVRFEIDGEEYEINAENIEMYIK